MDVVTRTSVGLWFAALSILLSSGCELVDNEEDRDSQAGLDRGYFELFVNPLFNTPIGGQTCSSSSCHQVNVGSGGSFRLHPDPNPTKEQLDHNYTSAIGFVNFADPLNSTLLLEPLAGSYPSVHAGGDLIAVGDANYQILATWLQNPVSADN